MYERFYGLARTPFAVTPDPGMLFMSKMHREALATIIYGVETRKGFIVCTGEVGTGKSTIIRAFFDQAAPDSLKLIYIFTPQVTPLEMARYVCGELGLPDPESVFAAVSRLQLKLLEVFEGGRTVVLMIDEAQLLPPETLEFLRLLSNFETDTEKLIQIVLVGQPEVDTVLARRDMRQVNQRVALRARLAAFGVEESFDYIEHRLKASGAQDLAQVMSPSAAWLIAEAAGGIPRRINILADNALIAGFGAGQRPLGSHLAGNAVRDFLAKSGAAVPAPSQGRLAAGWRAARLLRSAIARDKSEPAEWEAAAPAEPAAAAPRLDMSGPPVTEAAEPEQADMDSHSRRQPRPAFPAPSGLNRGFRPAPEMRSSLHRGLHGDDEPVSPDNALASQEGALSAPRRDIPPPRPASPALGAAQQHMAASEAPLPGAEPQVAVARQEQPPAAEATAAVAAEPVLPADEPLPVIDDVVARTEDAPPRRAPADPPLAETAAAATDIPIVEPLGAPAFPMSVEPIAPPRGADPVFVEPVFVEPVASANGDEPVFVEPVASGAGPRLFDPAARPPPSLRAGTGAAPARRLDPVRPIDRRVAWPALSRVRSGLQPRRRAEDSGLEWAD